MLHFHFRSGFKQLATAAMVATSICSIGVAEEDSASNQPGIVDERPTSGRFVALGGQYMVPYDVIIPGSDVVFRMEPIPGGEFQLGSPEDEAGRDDDEGPQVTVELRPYWMAAHEVTWTEYKHFTNLYNVLKSTPRDQKIVRKESDTGTFTVPTPLYDPSFTFALGEKPSHPAVSMTQYAAKQYTEWLSVATGNLFRLPTEAEWEYACRAGSTSRFSYGNDESKLGDYAWFYDNSDDTYHEVGQKLPNSWGLLDMHGNVGEMVLDTYQADAYAALASGNRRFVPAKKEPFARVVRGGAWDQDPDDLRSASRDATEDWRVEDPNFPKSPWWFTDEQSLCVGFRVVRPSHKPEEAAKASFFNADVEYIQMDVDNRLEEGRGVLGDQDPRTKK